RAFRRYAAWLVAISWKRFILLSVLLLIIAGVASEIPPFTWRIMETAPKVSTLHEPSGESADAAGSLAADIKREVIDEIRAGREQDAEKPHRVVARLDARDARERRDTGAGAAGGAPLPRDPEGAHGRPPAGRNQRRGGPVFGRLSADGAAIAGRERDQARPGAEAGRRRAEGGSRSGTRQAGGECGRHRRGVRPRRDRGNGDRPQQHPRAPQAHLRPASRAAHCPEFAEWYPGQRRRTLQDCMTPKAVIADDEALMREQLRARLAEVWPELEIAAEARNGAEAVELVAAERPDIVFLDIRMPGKSGIEAARE